MRYITDGSNSAELQEDLILHFARFCWVRRYEEAPSGGTWGDVFEGKAGMTLDQYRLKREAIK
jgi:hypothetical protein